MRISDWSSDVCSSDLWNSGLDSNGDGRVTAGEASDAVRGRVDGNIDEGGSTVPDKPSDPGDGGDTGSNPGNGASYTVRSGDRNYLVTAGAILPCTLQTAMDSTVPGYATCIIPDRKSTRLNSSH